MQVPRAYVLYIRKEVSARLRVGGDDMQPEAFWRNNLG